MAATSSLRVEELAEEENTADVISSEEQPSQAAPAAEDGSSTSETAPRRKRFLKIRDEDFDLPMMLTEEQYLQAKVAIFQYRMDHNIGANDVRNKVTPQRAAISQKIFVGARRPVQSVRMEEEESTADGNA